MTPWTTSGTREQYINVLVGHLVLASRHWAVADRRLDAADGPERSGLADAALCVVDRPADRGRTARGVDPDARRDDQVVGRDMDRPELADPVDALRRRDRVADRRDNVD